MINEVQINYFYGVDTSQPDYNVINDMKKILELRKSFIKSKQALNHKISYSNCIALGLELAFLTFIRLDWSVVVLNFLIFLTAL